MKKMLIFASMSVILVLLVSISFSSLFSNINYLVIFIFYLSCKVYLHFLFSIFSTAQHQNNEQYPKKA